MRAEIFRKRHPAVVWTIVIGRFVRLLRVVAMPRELRQAVPEKGPAGPGSNGFVLLPGSRAHR